MGFLITKRTINTFGKEEIPRASKILLNILRISIPAALETLLIGVIGLIDTMMVGSLGTDALASVSICQQPIFITLAAAFGLSAGITAVVSRRKGEGDEADARKTVRQAIIVCAIVGAVFTILSIVLARPFLILTGANEDTIDLACAYFRIVSSASIFNYLRLAICAALRAEGNTRVTLFVNIIANAVNVFLNYCLIYGNFGFPQLGVSGAAIATSIGNTVAFIVCIFILRYRKGFIKIEKGDDWHFDKVNVKNLITVSTPAFIEQLFMRFGFYIIAVIVNNLGTEVVAMNAIISGCISLAFNITDGFSIGAAALVGRSLGAKKPTLAFAYARICQLCSFNLGLIMISLIYLFRIPVSKLFSNDINVIEGASTTLKIAVFVIIPQSLQWVTTGALRGAGDVSFTAKTSMLSVAIVRPILSFLLCYPIGLGLLGSWIGMFIDQTIRFTLNNTRLTHLKWAHIKV